MSNLSLKQINKIYPNNVQAVFDFNLEIKDKEFIVFVGPSGCGKSTTLRMIAGLEDITYGELYIDGQLMNNVEPMNRHIAMVFQNYALYPHMTVYQNMAFALKLRKRNMPIYEENPEVDALREELKLIYKDIRKVDAKYKKDQNNRDLLDQHINLYKKVYEVVDKIKAIQKPIMGLNVVRIKELENKAKAFNKEIAELTKKLNAKNITDEEKDILSKGIKQREEMVAKITADAEHIKSTDTVVEKFRHLTKQEIDIEVNKVAESIDLTRYLFRKPAALSGGQRQRVALGRAIVRKPKVFLMDEPLSNLDAKLRVQTRSEISKLHKRVGATTIYVTHDQTEAMTMADRIVIMKDGYIQQVGTPNEVYNDPANKFVAGFIGSPSMNFLNGFVSKESFVFDNSKEALGIDAKIAKACADKATILGIRPEDIYVKGDKNNENPSKAFSAEVTYSELLGSSLIVYATIEGQNILFETKATESVEVGQKVELCFDLSKVYIFDKETEKRVK